LLKNEQKIGEKQHFNLLCHKPTLFRLKAI
jgi:hypothetical protein